MYGVLDKIRNKKYLGYETEKEAQQEIEKRESLDKIFYMHIYPNRYQIFKYKE